MKIKLGTVVDERYQILQEIGEGGFAHVYRAYDSMLDRELAIKVIKHSSLSDGDLPRFEREAKLLAKLAHENIVAVYSFNCDSTTSLPYIVMEYIRGESLRSFMNRKDHLSSQEIITLTHQICAGLAYAHKMGVVHRDLSPANIFVLEDGQNLLVKILDFGLSRLFVPSDLPMKTLTEQGMMLGNPLYMSPELIRGDNVDQRADIYALGCIIYECICGKPAFKADTSIGLFYLHENKYPAEPGANAGHDDLLIKQIALRCLQKDVNKRFQSCEEIVDLLNKPNSLQKLPAIDNWSQIITESGKAAVPKQSSATLKYSAAAICTVLLLACLLDPAINLISQNIASLPVVPAIEEPLAQFLSSAKRDNAAERIYEHLDTQNKNSNSPSRYQQSFDREYIRAEFYLLKNDEPKFFKMTEALLTNASKCSDNQKRLALTNRIWDLANQASARFANSTMLLKLHKDLFEEIMLLQKDGPSLRRAFDSLLSKTIKQKLQLTGEDIKALCNALAKYVAHTKRPLTTAESSDLDHLCIDYSNKSNDQLWLARISNTAHTGESPAQLRILYAQQILSRSPQLALKYAEEAEKASKDTSSLRVALKLEARVYATLGNYAKSVSSCEKGLALDDEDIPQQKICTMELWNTKTKSLYKLNHGAEFKQCVAQMQKQFRDDINDYQADEQVTGTPGRLGLSKFSWLPLNSVCYEIIGALADTRQDDALIETVKALNEFCKSYKIRMSASTEKLLSTVMDETSHRDVKVAIDAFLQESKQYPEGT